MNIADLDEEHLRMLLVDLQKIDDLPTLSEKYSVIIPQWLTIKYRCTNCTLETNNRIQSTNIKQAKKILTCPFCRKVSQMFTIRVQKETLSEKDFEL